MSYEEFLDELLPDAPSWAKEILVENMRNKDDLITELKGKVEELEAKDGK